METNLIYCGDSLETLKKIEDDSVDLIYLDPPFFSQKNYENFWIKDKLTKFRFSDSEWEKLRSSINPNVIKQYEDIEKRWKGGHGGIYVYIAYMRERLEQCWRVLKPTGSIYLHCDWHAGHYLKVMMDEVFGYNNFRNEIIWFYKRWTREGKDFGRLHDNILRYSKGTSYSMNNAFIPGRDPNRTKQKKTRVKGKSVWIGQTNEKSKGLPMPDVWEISIINPLSQERLGYPTQKPEALLERIIKASSNKGDLVLDPFCGCGTTLSVAKRLGRRWVGMDISRAACDVMKKRVGGRVVGGETEEELRKMDGHEFARLIINEKLGGRVNPKKSGDMGIDGWLDFMTIPVQVKNWGHKVGRPEVDKFSHAVKRAKKEKGIIVAFDFSRDCYQEVERIKQHEKIEIELRKVSEVIAHPL